MMRSKLSKLVLLCMVFLAGMPFSPMPAEAADYTYGVDVSGATATVWFKPDVGMLWVDIHYNIDSGAQENQRMTYNSTLSRYEYPITVAANNVINYSFTYFDGVSAIDTPWYNSTVSSSVSTPVIWPDSSGVYNDATTVAMTTTTSGAELYYTTDGSTPTSSSTRYWGPFAISQSTTIKAIGVKAGLDASAVTSASYTICTSSCLPDHGVEVAGTTATVWFQSGQALVWTDLHYSINSGAQQNVRMTYNSSKARYEQELTLAIGDGLNYNFTYFDGSSANDTPSYMYAITSDSQISPTTASFDKKVDEQADVEVTLTLNGNTFTGVWNGAAALTAGSDYTVDGTGTVVTIYKAYLAGLANGAATLVFKFSAGADQNLAVTVADTTPLDSVISPTTAAFDKNVDEQVDVEVTLTLNGNTLTGVWNGAAALNAGSDYTVVGNVVTIDKAYLVGLANGAATLVFKFSAGLDQNLSVTVTDTTPLDSEISPTTAAFDKNVDEQADVEVTLTLNGNTLTGVWNGASALNAGSDYTVAGNVVTIDKAYLVGLANGAATLVFKFSAGADQNLSLTVTDTTPLDSEISPTTASFDKKTSEQADVEVTLTLNGNTFTGIWNGAVALNAGSDYTVAGNVVTIAKEYLAGLSNGPSTLIFKFSAGADQNLSLTVTDTTPLDSEISPTTAAFDKKTSEQADVEVTLTLNGNTFTGIWNGAAALNAGSDYTVAGNVVTIGKAYLAGLANGPATLVFKFSAGSDQNLSVTVTDTTPLDSQISPTTAAFDKKTSEQADVEVTLTLNGNTFTGIWNGASALNAGTDYTVAGNVVTIHKAYLAGLANGAATLVFKFSAGADQNLSVTVTDTTPLDSEISPTTASFDKKTSEQTDVEVTLTLNGNTFTGIWNGAVALNAGSDYTVAGNVVTITKEYLAGLPNGSATLVFKFNAGADQNLSVTVTDTTPLDSQISPTTASFDKKTSEQADVEVTLTLNGNTFTGIWNGASALNAGSDYTVVGNVVTIHKAYLAGLSNGPSTLVFKFSAGADQNLSVTVTDTTPLDSEISLTTAAFDKKTSEQADVEVTLTLNGNTFTGIWNGAAALNVGSDYTVASNIVTIDKAYLAGLSNGPATLVFKFSAGADQNLSVTVTDTTPLDSQISPTTAAFDKKTSEQADVEVTLTLNGNTFTGIWNGAAALNAGTDYTVAGNVVTIHKAYLAGLTNGPVTLVFKFSAGVDQNLSVTVADTTPLDSQISPTTAAFDKKISEQADVEVTLTLNGNTFAGIWNGAVALTAGTDYTVAGNIVTIDKAYLAGLSNGPATLVFKFSAGSDQNLSVTVTDTTPLDSEISPTTASFDKKTSEQADVEVTLTLNGNTFTGIWNGAASLNAGTDYTVAGNIVTIHKAYLAGLSNGPATLVFKFSAGSDQNLSVTVTDTTPLDSEISPTIAAFDKKTSEQADVEVTLTLNGNTFTGIWNGASALNAGTDYTVAGNVVTIHKAYLAGLANGSATLVFKFSAGADQNLSVAVTDTTPLDSEISPTTAAFDKKTSEQVDIEVTLTLNGNTFTGIWNGAAALNAGTDYTVAGNVVTIHKVYLAGLANGPSTLVFKFSAGADQNLSVTVTDTTPLDSEISPTTAAFDKKTSEQADIEVTLTLNGNTFTGIWNGASALNAGTDYTVAGNVVTIHKAYLAGLANGPSTLVFKFSAGADQNLSITVTDTTPLDSEISPTTAAFDKKIDEQADIEVTLTLNGNTFTGIWNGASALNAGSDYTVVGNVVTIDKAYLAGLSNGPSTLVFKFSAGADQNLSVMVTDTTPLDSQISPTTAAFDKKTSEQVDIEVTLTLNGNTFTGIWNGAASLNAGSDYTVVGNVVTIAKEYLAGLSNGPATLVFKFSAGADQNLSVTVTDTTPLDSEISPTTALFDKKTSEQADIEVTLTLNGNTLTGIWNGASALNAGSDYTVVGNVVTIHKAYLAGLSNGPSTLVFKFSAGADQNLSVTVTDTTPLDSEISPTTAAFDKKTSEQADVEVALTLNGNTFTGIWNGAMALTAGTDYTVAGNIVTIDKAYLASLANGPTTLVFKFSAGADQNLSVTVTDTTPLDSQISPTTASFDKKTSEQADVEVTLTLNGNTFTGIWNGAVALNAGTDYTVAGNVVTIHKVYLAGLANGPSTLVFKFSAGADQNLSVTVTDTTPLDSEISPTTAAFDKKTSEQADVEVTLTLNGNTFTGIWNGAAVLTAGSDYTVAGNVVTIGKEYLAGLTNGLVTLIFKFSAGADQNLSVTVTDTTPLDSEISPTTAAFDKKTSEQADVEVTLTLNGNTFTGIWNGAAALTAGTDYVVAGNVVTIHKAYLAGLSNGPSTLVFKFSAGADQNLSVIVTDTTPLDSEISPTTASFDKKTSEQADVEVTLTLNGNTFTGIWNGASALNAGSDYTVAGNVITIDKAYLAGLANGPSTLVFKFSAGADQNLSVTVTDTTPLDSEISPTTALFDKKTSEQADIEVTLTLNGNTFTGIWNGAAALNAGTDYTVAGNVVTIHKAYLAGLANGSATLVFKFSAGADQNLSVTVTNTTPLDSEISPTTVAFDKKTSEQADVEVTLTLNGNTFTGIWNGAVALTAGTDYTVAGNIVTIDKAYLASLANGPTTLVFKFSAGADQNLSVTVTDTTPLDSQISPTTASFDKKTSEQADIEVTLTLNGNTFTGIWNGATVLTAGSDYTVAGNVVTIAKEYLAGLSNGPATLVFEFSAGADQNLSVTVTDTTPLDSEISPTTAAFDKKTSEQADVEVTLTLNGNTLTGIWNGAAALNVGSDYTVAGNIVTIDKAYLASLANGPSTLMFKFSAGADQNLSMTVTDTTPLDSEIGPTTASFDKKTSEQADIEVTLTLNGNMFTGIWNGAAALNAGTDYTIAGNVVTIHKAYLASLADGLATLVFKFSAGADQNLSVTVTDTTPLDSEISPTTAAFDKKTSEQADVEVTLTLNGNTFTGIWNGAVALTAGTDYVVAGNVVTIHKAYLAGLSNGPSTLVFKFSAGADQNLSVIVTDTTPLDSEISPTTASFDKKTSEQADVEVTLTLNGNTFTDIWNGAMALTAGTDYTVAGNIVTIDKAYLAGLTNGPATLVFKFSAGADQNLSIMVTDTTPLDSEISPTTAAFDKKASEQADVEVTLTLNGNTFTGVWNGASALNAGSDYTVVGNVVTIHKAYLASLADGPATLVFKFSAGADQNLSITVMDTTPLDSQISPTTAAFDKKTSEQVDIEVTLTLNGNTFTGIWNGAMALTAGTDYTVAGNIVTIDKAYLAGLADGLATLVFKFSAGADQNLSVTVTDTTPLDSEISPTTAAFDKKTSEQADVEVTLTLNGNTFTGVWNGASALNAGTDYTVAGNVVTIHKAYLASLSNGPATLIFTFSAGSDQNLSITMTDTTPLDSEISPTTAAFDKKTSEQADVEVTLTLNGNTFTGIWNGAAALNAGSDYTVAGNIVTIHKAYLVGLANGTAMLVFKFSAGADQNLSVTVTDTTPLDSEISPTTAAFDKKTSEQADVEITLTLNGNTFTGIWNGAAALNAGSDYTVAGNVVTIHKAYLVGLANGTATLVFKFSAGADQNLSITVTDTTPLDSEISPTTAAFDKKTSEQADVEVTLTLNGNTFTGIWNGAAVLNVGSDYTVAGNVVTIHKAYLAGLSNGPTTLVFKFSAGADQHLSITVTDTTSLDSQISPTKVSFDKKTSMQADVKVTLTLNGHTFTGIWNGAAALTAGTDYTAAGNVVTIRKTYLAGLANGTATLVFTFSPGADQSLVIHISNTTSAAAPPTPVTSEPPPLLTEPIIGYVESGKSVVVIVGPTSITRTREADGTVNDLVILTPERMKEALSLIISAGQSTVRVVLPDVRDEVSRTDLLIPQATTQLMSDAHIDLEIRTENVIVRVPHTSFTDLQEDVYFRLIPIKEEQQRRELENRARVEQSIVAMAQGREVNVIARPMTIETNLQSRPVTLILPVRDVTLPTDATQRDYLLASLPVYIEHSDGEKQVVKPQVVDYKPELFGLQFEVNKFSTFAILNMKQHHTAYMQGFVDGTFKPDQMTTRAEMAAILARNLGYQETAAVSPSYPDVKATHWAFKMIEFIKGMGIMVGDEDGNFRPDAPLTRGEMAVIAARYKQLTTPALTRSSFTDVAVSHWASAAIEAVRQAAIVEGYPDGTYRPNGNLTRAEAATIVNRLLNRGPLHGVAQPNWPDVPTTHWAYYEIAEASQDHDYTTRPEGGEQIAN